MATIDRTRELKEIVLKNAPRQSEERTKDKKIVQTVQSEHLLLGRKTFSENAKIIFDKIKELDRLVEIKHRELLMLNVEKIDPSFDQLIQDAFVLLQRQLVSLQRIGDENCEREKLVRSGGWFQRSTADESQPAQHEACIIWILNHRISNLSKTYEKLRDRMEAKRKQSRALQEQRQISLSQIPLHRSSAKSKPIKRDDPGSATAIQGTATPPAANIADKQLLLLQEENNELMQEYAEMSAQLVRTETSVNDIVRLQTTLHETLLYQSATIDRLFDEAVDTIETVRKGNTYLVRAAGGSHTFRWLIVSIILFFSFVLLFLHHYSP